METPKWMSIRGAIRERDWVCSIDLKDAYFHVPVHQAYRKFLRFSGRAKFSSLSVYLLVWPIRLHQSGEGGGDYPQTEGRQDSLLSG